MTLSEDLLKAQDKTASQIEKDFIQSIKATVRETDWEHLERDLAAYQHGDAIIDGIAWEDFDPKERLKKLFEVSLEANGAEIGKITGGAKFDFVDPRALTWIDKYCADLIVGIDDKTRAGVKAIVKNGYEKGVTPRNQAKLIKEIVGLDERRALALQKYSDNLFSKGYSEEKVWRLLEKKGEQLLNTRARTIAVNECSEASANASYWNTKSACERGILSKDEYEAYRIVAADERLCKKCGPIAGESREIPDGSYASTGSVTVKVHISCRCTEGIRSISMKKKKEMKESGRVTTDVVFEAKALKRKDGVIYCPTVPLVEGVFNGLGIPVLRLYEEFSKDAKWLQGLTVLSNHEALSPNSRRIGQLSEPMARDGTKDIAATTQFFEIDLTQREIDSITSRQPIHGSLSLSYNIEQTAGDWNGTHYEAIERGPYVFFEYSMVREGVVTPEDGAGFNMECKHCKSRSSAPGGADMEEAQVKEMIAEAAKPLQEKLATLEQRNISLEGELKQFKDSAEAKQEAEQKALFTCKLKPAHLERAPELWQECKKVGFLAFEAAHPETIIQPTQEKKLKGSAMAGEGGGQPVTLEEANLAHQKKMRELNQEA
jgi:hypothetical protein